MELDDEVRAEAVAALLLAPGRVVALEERVMNLEGAVLELRKALLRLRDSSVGSVSDKSRAKRKATEVLEATQGLVV